MHLVSRLHQNYNNGYAHRAETLDVRMAQSRKLEVTVTLIIRATAVISDKGKSRVTSHDYGAHYCGPSENNSWSSELTPLIAHLYINPVASLFADHLDSDKGHTNDHWP